MLVSGNCVMEEIQRMWVGNGSALFVTSISNVNGKDKTMGIAFDQAVTLTNISDTQRTPHF